MTDRVREALFDILGSYYGTLGLLPPLVVADAFAGSGSLGLEAVSRGAKECWFFETHVEALRTLRANIEGLHAGDNLHVTRHDVWARGLRRLNGGGIDLVFLDPPYAASRDSTEGGLIRMFLERGNEHEAWNPDTLVVLHHEVRVHYPEDIAKGWTLFDRRTYGSTAISFMRMIPRDANPPTSIEPLSEETEPQSGLAEPR